MDKCKKCETPLNGNRCSCEKELCNICCECPDECDCGCKKRKEKEEAK